MVHKTIDEINRYEGTTINPMHSPDEVYELYSVPSFDNDYPEIIAGAHIGSSKVTVRENDVLICKINPRINRVWVVKHRTEHPLLASSEWIVVRNPDMDADYLRWYFSSPTFRVMLNSEVAGIGGSLTRAQPKRVAQYTVPVRSLQEQKNIAAALNRVEELICLRKQQIAKLDELVKSRFVEMFGDLANPACNWPQLRLAEACVDPDDIKCGPFGTQLSKDEYKDAGVAVWEIPQINSHFSTQPTHYLTEEKAQQLDAYSLKPGDIAMSRKGNVGKCSIFPSGFKVGIIHSDVLRIRVDASRVSPLFMMHQLHYSGAVQHQIELVSSGAIMAGINVTKLKQIFVHIPPLELQNQFALFVEQTNKSKLTIQYSLAKLDLLETVLMQKYF